MSAIDRRPAWIREVELATCMHPQIILTGNVRDQYLLRDRDSDPWPMSLPEAMWVTLRDQGFAALLTYSHSEGLAVVADPTGRVVPNADSVVRSVQRLQLGQRLSWEMLTAVLRTVATSTPGPQNRPPVALMMTDAGRLFDTQNLDDEQRTFMAAANTLAFNAVRFGSRYPAIIWVTDRPADLPAWFSTGNHTIRTTVIPEPDLTARADLAEILLPYLDGFPDDAESAEKLITATAELTHGLHCRAISDIVTLATATNIRADNIADAIRAYRVGVPDNPWTRSDLRERISNAEVDLAHQVKGQPDAIRRVVDLLTRAATGMGGSQVQGGSSRPRGILFFAGPTGVGKTELAKGIAHTVFGDKNAYLRFDMSEFAAEQNEARLIGAPPGYLGFDAGGELTNGVRSRPFQVILFDEIEKAHPRILDKFLQILDDGRLTDGRGATVHFTESVIIFTTNLGVVVPGADGRPVQNVTPADLPETIDARIREYLQRFFRETLGRPELYNRMREGIVVFDFLRPPVPEAIADSCIERVLATATSKHGAPVTLTDEAWETVRHESTADITNGGRGVVLAIETILVNPLSRLMFEQLGSPLPISIKQVRKVGQNWEVTAS